MRLQDCRWRSRATSSRLSSGPSRAGSSGTRRSSGCAEAARRASARTSPTRRTSTSGCAVASLTTSPGRRTFASISPSSSARSTSFPTARRRFPRGGTTDGGRSRAPRSIWRCGRPGMSLARRARPDAGAGALRRLAALARAAVRASRCARSSTSIPRPGSSSTRRASGLRTSSRSSPGWTPSMSSTSRPPTEERPSTSRPIRASTRSWPRRSRRPCIEDPDLVRSRNRRGAARRTTTASAGMRSSTPSWRSRRSPFPPLWLNIKPSRFGSVSRRSSRRTTTALASGITMYGGGQFELVRGRGQIQYLASLFHADGPNDVAPLGYDGPAAEPGTPASPLPPIGSNHGLPVAHDVASSRESAYRVVRSGCTFIAESTQASGSASGAIARAGASGCAVPDSRRRCSPWRRASCSVRRSSPEAGSQPARGRLRCRRRRLRCPTSRARSGAST